MAAPKAIAQEFTLEKMSRLNFMCVESKCYDKGGDISTGRELSQGIKHVRSLKRKVTLEWKVKGAHLESLTSGTKGGKKHLERDVSFPPLEPWAALNNSRGGKG